MLRPLAVIALLAGSTAAHAAPPWNAFQAAFPLLPCQDGWAACLVGEAAVTPDLAHDATGAVTPADLRIGWFDLHATAAFSPFATLSVYPAAFADDAAAYAEAAPAPEPAPAPTQASRDAEEATRASE
ncbi:MAG: hypothetical protein H0V89_03385, partial [Deltaproteobacteria bacterium]|nr:hypothetical protein [Deltaproteobacteria bacterium]